MAESYLKESSTSTELQHEVGRLIAISWRVYHAD